MSENITLTITVSPDRAAYIMALLDLWSSDDLESSYAIRLLPDLLWDISLTLEQIANFATEFSGYVSAIRWDEHDKKAIRAIHGLASGRQLVEKIE